MKRLLASICLFSLLFVPVMLKRVTCGFKIAKISLNLPFDEKWEVAPVLSEEEIVRIVSQPFVYLDRGAQCYVFASADDRYVIKLFRYTYTSFLGGKSKDFDLKTFRLFSACVLAYTKAREETGLLFLHLNPTEGKLPVLHAKGPMGQSLSLPLDKYRFAIQVKAEPFEKALFASSEESRQKKIASLERLLAGRAAKGIRNADPSLSRNFGFLGDQALEIDFGNYIEGVLNPKEEVERYTRKLKNLLLPESNKDSQTKNS